MMVGVGYLGTAPLVCYDTQEQAQAAADRMVSERAAACLQPDPSAAYGAALNCSERPVFEIVRDEKRWPGKICWVPVRTDLAAPSQPYPSWIIVAVLAGGLLLILGGSR